MQPFTLTANPATFNHRQACKFLRQRIYGKALDQANMVILGVFVVVFLLLSALRRAPDVNLPDWAQWVALIALIGALYVVKTIKQTRMAAAGGATTPRTIASEFNVAEQGLRISSPSGHTFVQWHAIREVISTPQGLILLIAAMEYFSIPAEAFDSQADQDQTAERIKALITASAP